MMEITPHEKERINALQRYQILDTPPDGAFDRVTALASQLLNVPIAITSLVDEDRIWFKSHHGLDVEEIEREPGLCASAILHNVPYILKDASLDPRSLANPLVAGENGFRFYAGIPLNTHDNHNLGVLCVIDYKPRAITEQELEILRSLAQIVMDEMELRLASLQIDKLSKDKSDLLAVLSQEIKNPMIGILGMTELLHSTEMTDEQKEYTEIIETSGKALLTMVSHILNYSKMDTGKMEMNIQPFDIHFCVEQVFKSFKAEADKKGMKLLSDIDPEIPMVLLGDDHKIRQILVNLIENAIKYTDDGNINISVTLMTGENNPDFIHLSFHVKDSGNGIPNDQVASLFKPFNQVYPKGPATFKTGTGLGLSICKRLTEMMDGSIWLEETSEQGSTFSFEIKLPALT
ncbi:GAF domain-containing sensor histidine kinase [Bacillus sp. mrc49]|uniref:GAF domain-containing sensor histidine kinase n=1 Tax=Bacillus sp. mrc49 TaxID=2054913 RepID=UPI001E5E094B|nr:GAF domain-containing sensor histidine kinase [Bacillus sp. mrc49]